MQDFFNGSLPCLPSRPYHGGKTLNNNNSSHLPAPRPAVLHRRWRHPAKHLPASQLVLELHFSSSLSAHGSTCPAELVCFANTRWDWRCGMCSTVPLQQGRQRWGLLANGYSCVSPTAFAGREDGKGKADVFCQ